MQADEITITLTTEEALEARFCVRRYSALYPGMPNAHYQKVRESFAAKVGDAYAKWADEYEDRNEYDNETTTE